MFHFQRWLRSPDLVIHTKTSVEFTSPVKSYSVMLAGNRAELVCLKKAQNLNKGITTRRVRPKLTKPAECEHS